MVSYIDLIRNILFYKKKSLYSNLPAKLYPTTKEKEKSGLMETLLNGIGPKFIY